MCLSVVSAAKTDKNTTTNTKINKDTTKKIITSETKTTKKVKKTLNSTIKEDNKNKKITKKNKTTNTKKSGSIHQINANTFSTYFEDGTLKNNVNEGDTLDFQGNISGVGNINITKAVNIISSSNNAVLNDIGRFTLNINATGSKVTGITFYNTELFVVNASNIKLDRINVTNEEKALGDRTGVTSIRDNSHNVTVVNSTFRTKNNGGHSTLVLASATHCTITNNKLDVEDMTGNILYLNSYNVDNFIENAYNNISHNTITRTGGELGICIGIAVNGRNNNFTHNKVSMDGSGLSGAQNSDPSDSNLFVNNILNCSQVSIPGNAYNNTFNIRGYANTKPNSIISGNKFTGPVKISDNTQFNNNIANTDGVVITNSYYDRGKKDYAILISGSNNIITNNGLSSDKGTGNNAINNSGSSNYFENNSDKVQCYVVHIYDDDCDYFFNDEGYYVGGVCDEILLHENFYDKILYFNTDMTINMSSTSGILYNCSIIITGNSKINLHDMNFIKENNFGREIESAIQIDSWENQVHNCNITISGSDPLTAIEVRTDCEDNCIYNNKITVNAFAGNLVSTSNYDNIPASSGFIIASSKTNITNNRIIINEKSSTDNGKIAAMIFSSNNDIYENRILSNNISVNGSKYAYGLYSLSSVDNNIIFLNNITVRSNKYACSINFADISQNNNITRNNIKCFSENGTSVGIMLVCEDDNNYRNNKIIENNMTIEGKYSIALALMGKQYSIYNNSIHVNGSDENETDTSSMPLCTTGLILIQGNDSLIKDNNITSNGSSAIKLIGSTNIEIRDNYLNCSFGGGKQAVELIESTATLINNIPSTMIITQIKLDNITMNVDETKTVKINVSDRTGEEVNVGTVDIYLDNVLFKTVNLENEDCTIEIKELTIGIHNLTVNYSPKDVEEQSPSSNNTTIIVKYSNKITVNEENWSNIFNNDGTLKEILINPGSQIEFEGTINGKNIIISLPLNITSSPTNQAILNNCTITVTANSTNITRLKIRNKNYSTHIIILDNVSNILIRENELEMIENMELTSSTIEINGGNNNVIEYNNITSSSELLFIYSIDVNSSDNISIKNNNITTNANISAINIQLFNTSHATINNNTINSSANNYTYAILVNDEANRVITENCVSTNNSIENNTITLESIYSWAVYQYLTNSSSIQYNNITINADEGAGIGLADSNMIQIKYNNITLTANMQRDSNDYTIIPAYPSGIKIVSSDTGESEHNTIAFNNICVTTPTENKISAVNLTSANNEVYENVLISPLGNGNDGVHSTKENEIHNNIPRDVKILIEDTTLYVDKIKIINIEIKDENENTINNGSIKVYIDNNLVNIINLEENPVTIDMNDRTAGTYELRIEYASHNILEYKDSSNTTQINIKKYDTIITLEEITTENIDNPIVITGRVKDEKGLPIETYVQISVNDNEVLVKSNDNGEFQFTSADGIVGTNNITVKAITTDKYNESPLETINITLSESIKDQIIQEQNETIEDLNNTINSNSTIINLTNTIHEQNNTIHELNKSINDLNNDIQEQNKTIQALNETNQKINDMINDLNAKINDMNNTINSQSNTIKEQENTISQQQSQINKQNSKVNTKISIDKISSNIGKSVQIKVNVKTQNNTPVNGGKVLLKVNSVILTDTDKNPVYAEVNNGVAIIKYTIPNSWIKNPKVEAYYYGTDKYTNSNITYNNIFTINKGNTKISIASNVKTAKAGNKITLTIKHVDANTKQGLNSKVTLKIDGKKKTVKVKNGEGKLTYTIKRGLDAKTIKIIGTHSSTYYNQAKASAKIKVTKTTPTIKVTKTTRKSKKTSIKGKILDANNKMLTKNVKVTVKVDGKVVLKNKVVKKGKISLSFTKKLRKGYHELSIISAKSKAFNTGKLITSLKI